MDYGEDRVAAFQQGRNVIGVDAVMTGIPAAADDPDDAVPVGVRRLEDVQRQGCSGLAPVNHILGSRDDLGRSRDQAHQPNRQQQAMFHRGVIRVWFARVTPVPHQSGSHPPHDSRRELGSASRGIQVCWLHRVSDVTLILQAVGRGEKQASEELLPVVYEELRRMAAARMAREAAGHTLQPTALVHEAWMRLVEDGARSWENRAHFFGAASEAMRRVLVESARRKSRLKRGNRPERVVLEEVDLADGSPDEDILLIDEALKELESLDPERARVVVLKFFGGLKSEEVAKNLGIGERSVERHWAFAKVWLFKWIRAHR